MPATTQSYICEDCGGRGRIGHEHSVTDRYAIGEQQWRGYYPTNLCYACNGAGVWGVPKETEPPKPKPKPPKPLLTLEQQICGVQCEDWADREDPRDRL
jgi:hypothetical protein